MGRYGLQRSGPGHRMFAGIGDAKETERRYSAFGGVFWIRNETERSYLPFGRGFWLVLVQIARLRCVRIAQCPGK